MKYADRSDDGFDLIDTAVSGCFCQLFNSTRIVAHRAKIKKARAGWYFWLGADAETIEIP